MHTATGHVVIAEFEISPARFDEFVALAHNVKLKRAIKKDQIVSFDDVDLTNDLDVVKIRQEMENHFRPGQSAAA